MKSSKTSSWYGKAIQLLGGALVILLLSVPAFSQGNLGRIMGTVTDTSGGVVAGATVSVIDTARGITRTLTTDDAGEYNAPNLTPGNFTVRAEAKGFKKIERQSVDVEVGKEVRVDLQVQPGEQNQTVTVTESVPLVETTNATLGGTLDNSDIVDMPLNGRNYQMLLGLRPGVMIQPGGGPWTQSTNGVRPDESVWMIDGVVNSNFFDSRPILGMSSPITDAATILPIDAIQEFNTMENPKAEYGWKPGAVVNVGIKSGSNQFHGSAYGFYRSAAWDARNLYNPAEINGTCLLNSTSPASAQAIVCGKLPTQLKQYGGSVGGPIIKDKLFFFANYEGLHSLIGNAIVTSGIPETVAQTTADPAHSMVDAITTLQGMDIPISTVTLGLTGCTTGVAPACTGGFFPNNPSQGQTGYVSNFPNTNDSNNGIAKMDYHINDKNTISGLLSISNYLGNGEDHPFINSLFEDSFTLRTYTTSGNWIWTPSSNLVNEVRVGYNRMSFFQINDDAGVTDPISTGLPASGLPDLNVGKFNQLGTWHNRPQHTAPNPYEDFQESLSYLKGKHSMKFGVEYTHIEADSDIPNYGRGRVNFKGNVAFAGSSALEDFFAGDPTSGQVLVGDPTRQLLWSESALFAQDDWRVTPRLTINAGMRWMYQAPISASNSGWANFDPTSTYGITQQGAPGNNTMWKPDYHDFSPRLGFAYDMTGKGTTVVRGGFSIMYSTWTAVMWMNQNDFQNDNGVALAANPSGAFIQTGGCTISGAAPTCPTPGGTIAVGALSAPKSAVCWDPAIGGGACGVGGQTTLFSKLPLACGDGLSGDAAQCDLLGVNPNLRSPYIMNYNLGIQHQFGTNLSLEVGYVGNRGERLAGFTDLNQANPATGINPYGQQFPWLGFIDTMENDVHSNYNSLQATLTKRLSHGVSFMAGYTYAHGLDNGSLNRFGLLPQNSADPAAEYASSDFDVRHRLTLTATYNIPGIKGFAQMFEGWQINTIVNLQSGQPWETNDTNDNFAVANNTDFNGGGNGELTYRWNFMGDPANFGSGKFSIPYCTGPGAGGCTQTSGIFSTTTAFSATQSNAMWAQCLTADGAAPGSSLPSNLSSLGCYVSGNAVLTPPHQGTFGDMGRNSFRDSGFRDMDFSVFKTFNWKERYSAQFRLEVFNIFNHPIPANPYGASNGFNTGNDPSVGAGPGAFGASTSTPDVAAGNPLIGSGSARDLQVGLKLTF